MSSVIQLLPETVINQIAAGEVIERPASVVKELVENALDAGATEIKIVIEAGGKDLIRIMDNGIGMSAEDLEKCPLRHATSKLRNTEDLLKIATNGFRGEAVASIASIAYLTIETSNGEGDVGYQLKIDGGSNPVIETIVRPRGTTFQVRELFFNTPVRRNFLGSDALETSKIVDVLTRIALAHPDKRFNLKQGGRELLNAAPGGAINRMVDVIGSGITQKMLPFDYCEDGIRVHGYTSSPDEMRGKRNLQYFYMGKRPIQNAIIAKAVARAYEPYSKVGFPVVVLFLEMEGTQFDVNVHPAKKEVRFSNENHVYLAVHHAMREALLGAQSVPIIRLESVRDVSDVSDDGAKRISEATISQSVEVPISAPVHMAFTTQSIAPKVEYHSAPLDTPPANPISNDSIYTESKIAHEVTSQAKPYSASKVSQIDAKPLPVFAEPQDLFSQPEYGKVVPLSPKLFQRPTEAQTGVKPQLAVRFLQWSKTYIVCEDSQGLLLIDQNAASQRILFEQALLALAGGKGIESQSLLFPEIIDMSKAESVLLGEHIHELNHLGYFLEPFGGGSWQLRGIPIQLSISRAEEALRIFIANMEQVGGNKKSTDLGPKEVIAKSFAEGSAIPAGVVLTAEEMSTLLEQLVQTQDPYQAPSGKPALLRLPIEDMHARFKRAQGGNS